MERIVGCWMSGGAWQDVGGGRDLVGHWCLLLDLFGCGILLEAEGVVVGWRVIAEYLGGREEA